MKEGVLGAGDAVGAQDARLRRDLAPDAEANGRARVAALGGRVVPTTAIVAETIDDGWLVEVEVVAAA